VHDAIRAPVLLLGTSRVIAAVYAGHIREWNADMTKLIGLTITAADRQPNTASLRPGPRGRRHVAHDSLPYAGPVIHQHACEG